MGCHIMGWACCLRSVSSSIRTSVVYTVELLPAQGSNARHLDQES